MDDKAQGTAYPKSATGHDRGGGPNRGRRFRLVDLLVILLCLFGAAYSVNLFYLNLFQTIVLKNEKPVGVIVIKNNIVQRRIASRVLWDRLAVDSPAYMGDLIRTAALSAAILRIEDNSIDIGENTLIRIQRAPGGDTIQIELGGGTIGLTTGGGSIVLNLMGGQVEAAPGTILNASVENDSVAMWVSEGTATFSHSGGMREIPSGSMLALDANGAELMQKAAVVMHPRPNARYLKESSEPLYINFAWNRINLDPEEPLRLELAEDRNFNRIIQVIENLDSFAYIALDAGLWYWRLSLMPPATGIATSGGVATGGGVILSTGQLTVADASGLKLVSPVADTVFNYQDKPPQLRFQWSEIAEASSYILEAAETPSFINPRLRTQTDSVFWVDSSLAQGTWYWRVMPVFPSVYEGSAAFSSASFFRIEQGGDDTRPLVLPEPPPVIEQPEPEPIIEQPRPQPVIEPPRPEPQVIATPLLPAPLNRLPSGVYRVGIEQLSESRGMIFTWSAVQGANAYIFTLYEITDNGRRIIISSSPENRTSWPLENLATLGRGNFVWQVEAVNRNSAGTIEQRGTIGENSLTIDIPRPGQIQMDDPGILYGY